MQKIRELAKSDGVSINTWLTTAAAQKIGAVETAAQFLKRDARGHKAADLKRYLRRAADLAPRRYSARLPALGSFSSDFGQT